MRNHPHTPQVSLTQGTCYSGLAWVPTLMLVALVCAALLVVIPAEAEPSAPAPAASTSAASRYQQDRAACMNGQSNQDRATCLKEAGAAYAEAKHGGLKVTGATGGQADREANASQRCMSLPAEESKACMARMRGEGSTSGTAASGGILRELGTVQPAATAASAAVK